MLPMTRATAPGHRRRGEVQRRSTQRRGAGGLACLWHPPGVLLDMGGRATPLCVGCIFDTRTPKLRYGAPRETWDQLGSSCCRKPANWTQLDALPAQANQQVSNSVAVSGPGGQRGSEARFQSQTTNLAGCLGRARWRVATVPLMVPSNAEGAPGPASAVAEGPWRGSRTAKT